jgi:hypothetical protein
MMKTMCEKKQKQQQRQVQFDANVIIYEFAMRMGDNPAVSSGCPVAMASKHHNCEVRNFEMHEYTRNLERKQRQQNHHKNRHHHQNNGCSNSIKRSSTGSSSSSSRSSSSSFIIPVEKRNQILIRAGYSIQSIAKTILQVESIKEARLETLRNSGWDNFAMLAMDSTKVPKGILKAALGTTGDILSAATVGGMFVGSGVVVVGKQLTKAFGNAKPKTVQARSA